MQDGSISLQKKMALKVTDPLFSYVVVSFFRVKLWTKHMVSLKVFMVVRVLLTVWRVKTENLLIDLTSWQQNIFSPVSMYWNKYQL